jgi:hypothetical protein
MLQLLMFGWGHFAKLKGNTKKHDPQTPTSSMDPHRSRNSVCGQGELCPNKEKPRTPVNAEQPQCSVQWAVGFLRISPSKRHVAVLNAALPVCAGGRLSEQQSVGTPLHPADKRHVGGRGLWGRGSEADQVVNDTAAQQ